MRSVLIILFGSLICFQTLASNVNWRDVKTENLTLFYPGQSSWEWLLTKHKGAKSVRKGGGCLECHEDEEHTMGTLLVSGEKLEPEPIAGKPGFINAQIQIASSNRQLHVRIKWKDPNFNSDTSKDSKYETKVGLMIGTKSVKEFPSAGCWGVCHDDATNMKSHNGSQSRNLYTSASRKKIRLRGGGDDLVDPDSLIDQLDAGGFLELWQAKIKSPDNHKTIQGYVQEKRHLLNNSNLTSRVSFKNNYWTAEFTRALKSDFPGTHDFTKSKEFTFGIAVHDDYVSGRFHYVSFAKTFSLDKNADVDLIVARR